MSPGWNETFSASKYIPESILHAGAAAAQAAAHLEAMKVSS